MLLLLEKNSINIYELNGAMQQFQHDPVFDTFFSPYFVQPFYYVSRTLINESKFDQAAELLLYEDFLQLPEKEEGFKAIRMFFDEQIRTLKNLSPVTYQQGQQKIDNWIYAPWRNFLNALPEEFEPDKIELVFHLVNATVIFQKPNRHLAKSIAFELAEVKGIPNDLMKTINNNRKAFSQSTSSSSGNYGWMIWAGIILVKLISGC
ncbi:MAG: hypothetical protein EOO18_09735 [Chryseobacterium sp.]|nr:MAG: hypothetical protein EOO18_09735 [Chryseobacterium sp.]